MFCGSCSCWQFIQHCEYWTLDMHELTSLIYVTVILFFCYHKENKFWFMIRISDRKWYYNVLVAFGILLAILAFSVLNKHFPLTYSNILQHSTLKIKTKLHCIPQTKSYSTLTVTYHVVYVHYAEKLRIINSGFQLSTIRVGPPLGTYICFLVWLGGSKTGCTLAFPRHPSLDRTVINVNGVFVSFNLTAFVDCTPCNYVVWGCLF